MEGFVRYLGSGMGLVVWLDGWMDGWMGWVLGESEVLIFSGFDTERGVGLLV